MFSIVLRLYSFPYIQYNIPSILCIALIHYHIKKNYYMLKCIYAQELIVKYKHKYWN